MSTVNTAVKKQHTLLTRLNVFDYYRHSILAKYLNKQIFLAFIAIVFLLMLVLMGMQFLNFLRKASEIGIPPDALLSLVGLKVTRDFAPLLPLALFLAIIFSLGRLYQDSEAVVLNASGIYERNIVKLIQPIVWGVFLLVMMLTFYVIPWSKALSEQMMKEIDKTKHLSLVKGGKFQEFGDSDYMFYAAEVSDDKLQMKGIFSQLRLNDKDVIIVADNARQYVDEATKDVYLELKNGSRYYGFNEGWQRHSATLFERYYIRIHQYTSPVDSQNIERNNTRALPTAALLFSDNQEESAELHWRIAQPISVVLLAMLAVLLAKSSPREGRSRGLLLGMFIFVLYNNLLILSRSWMADGEIASMWGMWWVHLLLFLSIYLMYGHRYRYRLWRG